jgi:hypothetical protein
MRRRQWLVIVLAVPLVVRWCWIVVPWGWTEEEAPYPDLVVSQVIAPSSATAGEAVSLIYTIQNIGQKAAEGFYVRCLLTSPAARGQARLSWDASPEPDIVGYRVYMGTASGIYKSVFSVGTVTTFTVADLPAGATYFFAVTAYDSGGVESGLSDEVNKTINTTVLGSAFIKGLAAGASYSGSLNIILPAELAGESYTLTITADSTDAVGESNETNNATTRPLLVTSPSPARGQAHLSWNANPEPDVVGYRVYLGMAAGVYTRVTSVGDVTTYTVIDLPAGEIYFFAVTVYNIEGIESGFSTRLWPFRNRPSADQARTGRHRPEIR